MALKLAAYVRNRVRRETSGWQTPHFGRMGEGEITIAMNEPTAALAMAAAGAHGGNSDAASGCGYATAGVVTKADRARFTVQTVDGGVTTGDSGAGVLMTRPGATDGVARDESRLGDAAEGGLSRCA